MGPWAEKYEVALCMNFFLLETLIMGYDEIFYSKSCNSWSHYFLGRSSLAPVNACISLDRERNSQRLYISCIYFKNMQA